MSCTIPYFTENYGIIMLHVGILQINTPNLKGIEVKTIRITTIYALNVRNMIHFRFVCILLPCITFCIWL